MQQRAGRKLPGTLLLGQGGTGMIARIISACYIGPHANRNRLSRIRPGKRLERNFNSPAAWRLSPCGLGLHALDSRQLTIFSAQWRAIRRLHLTLAQARGLSRGRECGFGGDSGFRQ